MFKRSAFFFVAALLFWEGSALAGEYVVDGFTLGGMIDRSDSNYTAYACDTSPSYRWTSECSRLSTRQGQLGDIEISSSLIHAWRGDIVYAEVHAAPVKLSRRTLEKELIDLTNVIGEEPSSVSWLDISGLTSVVATWGEISLEEVRDAGDESFARRGALVDLLGDPLKSLDHSLPLFRLSDGPGYVFTASFDANGRGDRHYIAANPRELLNSHYESVLASDDPLDVSEYRPIVMSLLRDDARRPVHDYSLWPYLASATRRMALATSTERANQALDDIVSRFGPTKLASSVWATLPTGAIRRLKDGQYWRFDVYGPNTRYPEIRNEAQRLIAAAPNDPFIEFAYLLVGRFDEALAKHPDSVISPALNFAAGFTRMQSLVEEALVVARQQVSPATSADVLEELERMLETDFGNTATDDGYSLEEMLSSVNDTPALLNNKLIASLVPSFLERRAEVQHYFDAMSGETTMSDDAAYMSAWLANQSGDVEGTFAYIAKGLEIGKREVADDNYQWADYRRGLLRLALQMLYALPLDERVSALERNQVLREEGSLWYALARQAFRDFDYSRVIAISKQALAALGISEEQLPATTDRNQIADAIQRQAPELAYELNVTEIPYLLEASREMASFAEALAATRDQELGGLSPFVKSIVIKYSLLLDPSPDSTEPAILQHQDLRQALRLIEVALQRVEAVDGLVELEEWLHYRKVRILGVYDPELISQTVARMVDKYPSSELLDDALAEDIYARGMLLNDIAGAQSAFDQVLRLTPGGNAVDNAYNWMQIINCRAGRAEEASRLNREIIRLFPTTRHALNSLKREMDPARCSR